MKLAMAVGVIGLTCMAQTTPPKKDTDSTPKRATAVKTRLGVVSGRIFVITKGGDIKPARLAAVYLLSWDGVESSAAQSWYDALHKARQEYINKLEESQSSDYTACKMELLMTYDEAILAVLNSTAAPKQPRVLISQADEEGTFKMADVQPGLYTIVASGRAGFNEARWKEGPVEVKSGSETSLKLASPDKACLDLP